MKKDSYGEHYKYNKKIQNSYWVTNVIEECNRKEFDGKGKCSKRRKNKKCEQNFGWKIWREEAIWETDTKEVVEREKETRGILSSEAVNCSDYTALVVDRLHMSMGHWLMENDKGKLKYRGKNLPRCHLVHNKCLPE